MFRKSPPPNFENDKVAPAAEGSRVIAVSFASQPQTKTTLEGLQPKFVNEKDTILLFTVPENGNEPLLTDTCVVKVDGSGKATISTDLTGKLRALYPAKAAVLEDDVITAEVLAVQSGKFADANIAAADIDENNSAQFENVAPLLIITPPSGTKKLIVRSLKAIGEDGQRSKRACSINTSADKKERCTVTVLNPDDDGKYYVALYCDNDVKLSDMSFEAWFDNDGTTGSVKGIPTSKIAAQATALDKKYGAYNEVQYGTAYTIDDKNWHEYVTVGGRKWATMNIGAESVEKAGEYFMWGYTVGHTATTSSTGAFSGQTFKEGERGTDGDGFAWSNYIKFTSAKYTAKSKKVFVKYVPSDQASDYGNEGTFSDDKTTLDLADDAAYANWGGAWRMPTKEEFDALKSVTGSAWDGTGTVKGYRFGTSPNQIFLPAAGSGYGTDLDDVGDDGCYWSSSLRTDYPSDAYYLDFYDGSADTDGSQRFFGLSVRAIIDDATAAPASGSTADDFNLKDDDTGNWE